MDNSQLDYTVPKPELERSEQFIQPWQVSNQFIVTWINETSYWSLFLATSRSWWWKEAQKVAIAIPKYP